MNELGNFFVGRAHAAFGLSDFTFLNPISPGSDPVATVSTLIGNVIGIFLTAAAIGAFFYLLSAGFKYITSGGDTGKADEARKGISNALIGVIIILLSYVILRFVGTALLGTGNGNNNATRLPTGSNTTQGTGTNKTNNGTSTNGVLNQANATAAATKQAQTAAQIAAQISAGLFPGIGPVLSQAIGNVFGAPTVASATASDCINHTIVVKQGANGNCVDANGNVIKDASGNPISWSGTGTSTNNQSIATVQDCLAADEWVYADSQGNCIDAFTGNIIYDYTTGKPAVYNTANSATAGTATSIPCALGYVMDATNGCVPSSSSSGTSSSDNLPPVTCTDGYIFDNSGSCVPDIPYYSGGPDPSLDGSYTV